jgi:cytochrome c biogenesis protein CcdA
MFDPISQALAAVGSRSAYAAPVVFAAGAASSIGPCVAPRFIAVSGLAAGKARGRAAALVFAFIAGLTVTYAAFGAVSSLLGRAMQLSTYTYWAVALTLATGGCIALWRGEKTCSHARRHDIGESSGSAMLLGSSFALVVSPCCTPLIVGILAYTSAAGNAGYGSLLLACFALGHALPIVPVALSANGATRILQRYSVQQAASVVSATLMLGLSAYYAVLA